MDGFSNNYCGSRLCYENWPFVRAGLIGETTLNLGGETVPLRPNIGIYPQPISFIGLPVAAVPVSLPNAALPIGVQVIAAPWREYLEMRAAWYLEQAGVCGV